MISDTFNLITLNLFNILNELKKMLIHENILKLI